MIPGILHRESSPTSFSDRVPPLLQRIYGARGLLDDEQLDLSLSGLLSPTLMAGVDTAVALLGDTIIQERPILIVADFDADGATSAALMILALRAMGVVSVDYLVPDRFRFGYGLTPEIVDVAAAGKPHLIVTVDNGISSLEGVSRARELGMKVLITDHHLPGETLPAADAIVNPNQPGCDFPSKVIAGVGVAFYLLSALRSHLRTRGWFDDRRIAEPVMADFLDLVALGTVADVVKLDRNNRIMVSEGIRRIRAQRTRPGIEALIEISGRQQDRLVTSDLAFAVAPRLNAAGRLEDMALGIECLLTDDPAHASRLAQRLHTLNIERREIEGDMKAQAENYLQQFNPRKGELPNGVCLYHPDWHQGVVGILASRIKEKVNRPVIAFAAGEGDASGELKGSGRSVAGFHIRDALQSIDSRHPDLIMKFGGHAMAAGLTLARYKLDKFKEAFDLQVTEWLGEAVLEGNVLSDGELGQGEFHLSVAEMLRESGPWGEGFPEPTFDGVFDITFQRIIGTGHLKLRVKPASSEQQIDAIFFNRDTPSDATRVRLVYRLDINEYRGNRSVQLMVEALLPVSDEGPRPASVNRAN